jgi:hypothetical protein
MKHEYHEGSQAGENFDPTEQLTPTSTNSVSLIDYLLHGPKVDEFEITRDPDTGRDIELPD